MIGDSNHPDIEIFITFGFSFQSLELVDCPFDIITSDVIGFDTFAMIYGGEVGTNEYIPQSLNATGVFLPKSTIGFGTSFQHIILGDQIFGNVRGFH